MLTLGTLLLFNVVSWKQETELTKLRWPRRYWEDTSGGIKLYLDRQFPRADAPPSNLDHEELTRHWETCRDVVAWSTRKQRIRPTELWRTIPGKPLLRVRDTFISVRPWEDQGRATILALGFRLLGGVSPYLLLWLGLLACLPVLAWTCWEFVDAGWPITGFVLPALWSSSPFIVDCLTLPHSGAGFYLIALLGITGLSAYATLSHRLHPIGALTRALGVGTLLAICAFVRSNTAFLLPGFVLALAIGCFRFVGQHERQKVPRPNKLLRGLILLGVTLASLCPFWLLNPPRPRPVWVSIWEGLGDFDTTKNHYWRDAEAARVLREAGLEPGPNALFSWLDESGERFFRDSVLHDIRSDPFWFLRILRDRCFATVTQEKLWPWSLRPRRWTSVSIYPNQADMDKYYRLVTPVDRLSLGNRQIELPIPVLLVPTALLLCGALAAYGSSGRWRYPKHAVMALAALSPPALAALGSPMLMTTASAIEPQAFTLIYFVGLGLLLDTVVRGNHEAT